MPKKLEDYSDGETISVAEFYRLIDEEPPPSQPAKAPRKHEEADFQRQVQDMARIHGWLDWHVLKAKV